MKNECQDKIVRGLVATRPANRIRILIVDGDSTLTTNTSAEFRRAGCSVSVAHSLAAAQTILHEQSQHLDIVILELHLPDGRGETLLPLIEGCIRQPVTIITSSFLPDLHLGALQYRPIAISKPISTTMLLRIAKTVGGGYAAAVIRRFVNAFELSRRETEATLLLAQGLKAKEIAGRMRCSEPTVYGHIARICEKTGCVDYHELVARLFEFACHARGHTPPDYDAFVDEPRSGETIPDDSSIRG